METVGRPNWLRSAQVRKLIQKHKIDFCDVLEAPRASHPKLPGQSIRDLNYTLGFGNEEKEGNYNHYNKDFMALRENKYLNTKMFPKQTHNPGISSLHQI